jgi:hypothetical protein
MDLAHKQPCKYGIYYDPRFTDVLPNGDVVPLDKARDEDEAKELIKLIENIRTARTISV